MGDSQRRQFRPAAFLIGKSNNGRALSAARQDDLVDLYDALNRMPSLHHTSPRHEKMTLEEICTGAEQQTSAGTAGSYSIGLDVGTINRHFANLKQLCGWMAFKTPMALLDFSDFILE